MSLFGAIGADEIIKDINNFRAVIRKHIFTLFEGRPVVLIGDIHCLSEIKLLSKAKDIRNRGINKLYENPTMSEDEPNYNQHRPT